jgi:hypothetical protein
MYTFSLISVPLFYYLISRCQYTSVPSFIRKTFPGILWPEYWPLDRDSIATLLPEPNAQSLVRLTNQTNTSLNTTSSPQFRYLYNFEEIFAQLSRDVVVSLTFGLCCPPLAILILFVIWMKYFCSKVILNRFFCYRTKLVQSSEQTFLNSPRNSLFTHRDTSLFSSSEQTSFSEIIVSDPLIQLFNSSFSSVEMAFEKCFPPILLSSTVFFGLLSWDISADEISWKKTISIPVMMVTTCLLLFLVLYHYHIGLIAECRVLCEKWNDENSNGKKKMMSEDEENDKVVCNELVKEMSLSEMITNRGA